MRTVRLGVLIGVAGVGTAFAMSAVSCASATTITLDIRTRPELCSDGPLRLSETGIAVTVELKVDKPVRSPLTSYQKACANSTTGSIGTLVITPSGAKNEQVAVRIVAALNENSASNCDDSEGKALLNCIVSKRLTRFVEGKNVDVTIMIEPECNGVECPAELVCVKGGKCAPVEAIPSTPEGEVDAAAIQDASGVSDVEPEKPDTYVPPPFDGGPCSGTACTGKGRNCNRDTSTCTITCATEGAGCNTNVCPDDRLAYEIVCRGNRACENTRCEATKRKVTFDCSDPGGGEPRCKGIQCDGSTCEVTCADITNTCSNVLLAAETSKMTCSAVADNKPACDAVTCIGKTCERKCNVGADGPTDAGCGTTASCDASAPNGCNKFQINLGYDAAVP